MYGGCTWIPGPIHYMCGLSNGTGARDEPGERRDCMILRVSGCIRPVNGIFYASPRPLAEGVLGGDASR